MHTPSSTLRIGQQTVGVGHPTYFIADIGANHDGDLSRAKALIHQAADAGAQAAKFQHFTPETIVSEFGTRAAGKQSHQANWQKSVFEMYRDASINPDWTAVLKETCDQAGITFFTSPYSLEWVDKIDPFVPAFKIGSGDITWPAILRHAARKGKPVILATGASNLAEVQQAVATLLEGTPDVALLQCNTNYTSSPENFRHLQLNVLRTYASMYPGMVLGLSDHTLGHASVLGAVALGARMIEKHFTDDRARPGNDHAYAMNPADWKEMILRTRELEAALGTGEKKLEENERQTVVVQRRAIRASRDLPAHTVLGEQDLEALRPCPPDALPPTDWDRVVGQKLRRNLQRGEHVRWTDLEG